jgi:Ribbon-helix-helix protein, copG family
MMDRSSPRRVREPVQVYLDRPDRQLLEELARRTGLPRAELLRRGLRRFAQAELAERRPGWSLDVLIGAMGDDPRLPADLSVRHDEYLYGGGYDRLYGSRGHRGAGRPRKKA